MVDQVPPRFEVLTSDPPARSRRSQLLLDELASALHIPVEVAEQQAYTHALAVLRMGMPLYVTLPGEPVPDHKRGVGDG